MSIGLIWHSDKGCERFLVPTLFLLRSIVSELESPIDFGETKAIDEMPGAWFMLINPF